MAQDDIQGQVVDAQGNPVSGAIVELTKSYQSSPTGQEAVQRTTTDSNGNYIFEGHPDGDGTTQEWHVSCYNHDGTAYVNSFNNPGVTADLPSNAIPDSGDLQAHYDFSEEDGSTPVTDQSGNGFDLSGTYSGVGKTINGIQAGSFDGTDDELNTTFSVQSQPNHVFLVVQPDVVSGNESPFDSNGSTSQLVFITASTNNWAIFGNSTVSDGAASTSPVIISGLFNGSNSAIRVNGAETTGDVGTGSLEGLTVGARRDGSNNFDGAIGEVLVYPQDKSAIVTDVEQYLSDKWGIAI